MALWFSLYSFCLCSKTPLAPCYLKHRSHNEMWAYLDQKENTAATGLNVELSKQSEENNYIIFAFRFYFCNKRTPLILKESTSSKNQCQKYNHQLEYCRKAFLMKSFDESFLKKSGVRAYVKHPVYIHVQGGQ